jgi:4-diphosphocytidyl-2-C-methyl-D-erythritol kinase
VERKKPEKHFEGEGLSALPVTISAPAKINLFLEVLEKLPSGKHELISLMARLELSDTITISLREGDGENTGEKAGVEPRDELRDELREKTGDDSRKKEDPGPSEDLLSYELRVPGTPDPGFTGKDNLVLRAISSYRGLTGFPEKGLRVRLVKNIPLAGGLGGGSSDSATVRMALNRLSGFLLKDGELQELALSLGADVPFFLGDSPLLLARGVGERLSPWKGEEPFPRVLLINPGTPLKTGVVFREYELTKKSKSNNLSSNPALWRGAAPPPKGGGSEDLGPYPPIGYNALAPAAFGLSPVLEDIFRNLKDLKEGPVGLSGSGPTLFGLFKTEEKLLYAKESFKGYWTAATCIK